MKRFETMHPAVAAAYFLSVLLMTMFVQNPVLSVFSLAGGIAFGTALEHKRFWRDSVFYLVLFLLIAVTNPLFVHDGATPLFFLSGKAVTWEAVLCGANMAVMLIAAVCWFRCLDLVLTEDKLLFLLGKASPKLALLICSALRFVPLLKTQAAKIRTAQRTMGLYSSDRWMDKLKGTLRVYSVLMTWALENAADSGASMRGRGYGVGERTHFALFRFLPGDGVALAVLAVLDTVVITATALGRLTFTFYPRMVAARADAFTVTAYIAFGLLTFLPAIFEKKETLTWRYYRSKS